MKNWLRFLLVVILTVGSAYGFSSNGFSFNRDSATVDSVFLAELPREAQQTLTLIKTGGPFPYSRDGIVFGNYEKLLPLKQRGYYLEYTVKTPGQQNRGARRIIAGEKAEYYYTDDHYKTFRRIRK